MASKRKYYAVAAGHSPGIYDSWAECELQVKGFRGQKFKSFPTKAEANQYLLDNSALRMPTAENKLARLISTSNPSPPASGNLDNNPFRNYAYRTSGSVLEMAPADYEERVERCTSVRNLDNNGGALENMLPKHLTPDFQSVSDNNVMYQLEYDGAAKGNPGAAGAGALLRHPDGTVVCEISVGLGKATNNVAEYRGLIAGLRKALDLNIQYIQAQGDSKLVTMQVRGKWKIKNENLAVLCGEAVELVKNFKDFCIRHVDREYNSAADALANKGVGLPEEKFISSFS